MATEKRKPWIKEANKMGRYEMTYRGFRIYVTKEPQAISSIVERGGEKFNRTDFIKGDFVAVDRTGCRLEDHYIDSIGFKIDMEILSRS